MPLSALRNSHEEMAPCLFLRNDRCGPVGSVSVDIVVSVGQDTPTADASYTGAITKYGGIEKTRSYSRTDGAHPKSGISEELNLVNEQSDRSAADYNCTILPIVMDLASAKGGIDPVGAT